MARPGPGPASAPPPAERPKLGEDALSSLLGLDGLVEQEEASADERRLIGILRARMDESVGRLSQLFWVWTSFVLQKSWAQCGAARWSQFQKASGEEQVRLLQVKERDRSVAQRYDLRRVKNIRTPCFPVPRYFDTCVLASSIWQYFTRGPIAIFAAGALPGRSVTHC